MVRKSVISAPSSEIQITYDPVSEWAMLVVDEEYRIFVGPVSALRSVSAAHILISNGWFELCSMKIADLHFGILGLQ